LDPSETNYVGSKTEKSNVVFLFGAGASVDAGIPDTYKLVTEFKHHVEKEAPELGDSLTWILSIIEEFNERHYGVERKEVDVEQLLVALERLKDRENDMLWDFCENKTLSKKMDSETTSRLEDLLQNFIRKRVIVEEKEKLEYLQELVKFVPPTLEVYSVNYDTCIEQLCYLNNLKYTDGFDIYWSPRNLDRKDWDVKLFKMHGSVIWFESQTKEYVKIPIQTFIEGKETKLKLITGEDLTPLLIYPMQKWQYIEPLTELQLMLKKRLIDEGTKILVVVGYSFRDDYIIRMLWDAARVNNDLRIVLVNPSSQEIFDRKLKFLDDGKTPSRLADRVVCLPYPFRTIVHHLKNAYLRSLENCVGMEKDFIKLEKLGGKSDWQQLLKVCIDCEFSTKTEMVFEERIGNQWLEIKSWTGENAPEKIRLCMKAFLHSSVSRDEFESKWIYRMNKLFEFTNIDNLMADVDADKFSLGFHLGTDFVNSVRICETIDKLIAEAHQKADLLGDDLAKKMNETIVKRALNRLDAFKGYLGLFSPHMRWTDYFKLRANSQPDMARAVASRNLENLRDLMLETERNMLKTVIQGQSFTFGH